MSYLCKSCKILSHSLHKALFFPLWTHYLLRNVGLKILPTSKHLLTQVGGNLSQEVCIMEGCFGAFLNHLPTLCPYIIVEWSLALKSHLWYNLAWCSVPSTNISSTTISSWTLTSSQNLLAGYKCLSLAERICYPTLFTKTVHYYFTASNGQIGHNERNRVCCFNWAKQFKVPKNAVFPQNPKSESLKVKWGLRSLQITGPSEPGVHGLLPPRFLKECFLVNADLFKADLFKANFTNTAFQKIPIPHFTLPMRQKFLH